MLEIDISNLVKQYAAANILVLFYYNLFFHQIPITTIIPIQLLLSINLIFVGLYALFKYNVILASSNRFNKSFAIAAVTQYALVLELLKLISESEEFIGSVFYSYYFSSVLFHSIFNDKYPQFFDKFKKFNFGFTVQYLILIALNVQVNKIIPCTILGIVFVYFSSLTFDHMTVITSGIIYSAVLIEGWIPLVIILSPSKDTAAVLIGFLISGIATFVIYVLATIIQIKKVNSTVENGFNVINSTNDVEKCTIPVFQTENTGTNNYFTFTN